MSKFETFQETRRELRGNVSKVVEYNILTLLIGELETAASRDRSEITSDKVIAGVRKLIKSNTETLKLVANPKLVRENAYLETFLPLGMTAEQISDAIKDSGATNMGAAMKALKANPDAVYDPSLASQVAKALFQ
jgi:uncharacterized protein YqeY